ncbi:hypothetical protein MKW98_016214 [Papaver atlanticum]|uniref:Longin domain-containing protein n=1 Tax=Papaver atlanticum TaxID=357466 RepID=A0AAD4SJ88_9MAGN|nr:hypothetical protein MKW98_016214 [Papaver atlanticum]
MSQRGLIYSFVVKGIVFLAEHTSFSGNFSTIAHTYSCDGHTFNFLNDNGLVFLVVADEETGRSIPLVFLERVKDDFKQRYAAIIGNGGPHPLADDEDLFEDPLSIAYNLDRGFGPRLKEHMQYCMSHPEEISKLSKLKAQMFEVKGITMDNIEKLNFYACLEQLMTRRSNQQQQPQIWKPSYSSALVLSIYIKMRVDVCFYTWHGRKCFEATKLYC